MPNEWTQILQTATIILGMSLAFAITWGIRTLRKSDGDPKAMTRLKLLAGYGTIASILMAAFILAPQIVTDYTIEPMGGVDKDYIPSREQRLHDQTEANRGTEQPSRSQADQHDARNELEQPTTEQTTQDVVPEVENIGWSRPGMLASILATERIIVHQAQASLVVNDIRAAIDHTAAVANKYNGWVVTSSQTRRNTGQASIRVPATELQNALQDLQDIALNVEALDLSSEDVTESYVDTEARLKVLKAAEANYINMLQDAGNIEHHLRLQEQITQVQTELEQLQGRLRFLTTVSAFSLIDIDFKLAPKDLRLDAGQDRTVQVNTPVLFDALLTAPEGMDYFQYEWQFGDASLPARGTTTALILVEDRQRITNP